MATLRVVKEYPDGYRVGTWAGFPNYECMYANCGFKIMILDDIITHVKEHRLRSDWEQANGQDWDDAHPDGEFAVDVIEANVDGKPVDEGDN